MVLQTLFLVATVLIPCIGQVEVQHESLGLGQEHET